MPEVPTFPAEGLKLLASLERNNSTEWFHRHKAEYAGLVRDPMLALVEYLNGELARFAPRYVNTKKNPVSRPNRDTRFSSDKSPYKTDISSVWPLNGKEKHEAAGFFLSVGPDGAEVIAGSYMPGTPELARIRKHLDSHHMQIEKLLGGPALKAQFGALQGEQLKRIPRGYPDSHPAADLLRRTQLYLRGRIPAREVTSATFAKTVAGMFRTATPFVAEIDKALGN